MEYTASTGFCGEGRSSGASRCVEKEGKRPCIDAGKSPWAKEERGSFAAARGPQTQHGVEAVEGGAPGGGGGSDVSPFAGTGSAAETASRGKAAYKRGCSS